MIPKESILYSVIFDKCPRCHEGDMYIYKNPYTNLNKVGFRKLHDHCSVCSQPSEPEPGFYQGAMYVSYAVSVAISFLIGGILLFTNLTPETILVILSVCLILLLPWIFRVSRMIWMNFFVRYKPELSKHK